MCERRCSLRMCMCTGAAADVCVRTNKWKWIVSKCFPFALVYATVGIAVVNIVAADIIICIWFGLGRFEAVCPLSRLAHAQYTIWFFLLLFFVPFCFFPCLFVSLFGCCCWYVRLGVRFVKQTSCQCRYAYRSHNQFYNEYETYMIIMDRRIRWITKWGIMHSETYTCDGYGSTSLNVYVCVYVASVVYACVRCCLSLLRICTTVLSGYGHISASLSFSLFAHMCVCVCLCVYVCTFKL